MTGLEGEISGRKELIRPSYKAGYCCGIVAEVKDHLPAACMKQCGYVGGT